MMGIHNENEELQDYVKPSIDPQLEELQKIEAGGPPKPVNFNTLPTWLRYFGYFFIGVLLLMGIFGILASSYDEFLR